MFSKFLITIPLITAVLVLLFKINKPFIGHHDFMGAFMGKIALVILEKGILAQGWTSYLPTLPLLISISFIVFGVSEWAVRFIPLTFSIVGVCYFYLVIKKLWNIRVALIASLFYTLTPMFVYFGKLPVPDIPIIGLLIASFYYYLLWLEKNNKKNLFLLCICFLIAASFGWTSGYFSVLIIAHSLFLKRFKKELLILPLIFLISLTVQFSLIFYKTGQLITNEILSTIKFRLTDNNISFGGQSFTLVNYIRQEISWFQAYFTRVLIFFSGLYLIKNFFSKINIQKLTVLFFLILGLCHPMIFSRYVFIHDFLNIYMLPFYALAGALGVDICLVLLEKLRIITIVRFGFVILILVIFVLERLDFTKALLDTKMNTPGIEMANILNGLQQEDNEAVILSPRFDSFYGVFTNFYSKNAYTISTENDLKKLNNGYPFKYIITIDEDITDKSWYQNLQSAYVFDKNKELTIFYTNEAK